MRGALLPAFGRQFGVGTSALGLVAPAGAIGFIAALVLTGAMAGRLDAERTLFASAALVSLSMLALGLAPSSARCSSAARSPASFAGPIGPF